jgi:uncharacterized protein DUF4262
VVNTVAADPEGPQPGFSYSLRLYEKGLPEFIYFGVGAESGHAIVNDVAGNAIAKDMQAPDTPFSGVIAGFSVRLHRLTPEEIQRYLKASWCRSRGTLDAIQIVWPEPAGHFLGDHKFDVRFDAHQPHLGTHAVLPTAH